jgi:hypothetical protein
MTIPRARPHVSWRERSTPWRGPHPRATAPPDYTTSPVNVIRHWVGAAARDMEVDRMYYEYNTPPATPQAPNLVWPRSKDL